MSVIQARGLRRRMTDAERALWSRLRDRQLDGHKFRRQHPLGPFVVDFFCEARRLVVELGGGQHAWQTSADLRRTQWLEEYGCRVVRFWNNDVLGNTDGVMLEIAETLRNKPLTPRPPLPVGEEENGLD